MEAIKRPFASYGVAGMTVFRPAVWQIMASSDCEWWAAVPMPAPRAVRTTMGHFICPPNM